MTVRELTHKIWLTVDKNFDINRLKLVVNNVELRNQEKPLEFYLGKTPDRDSGPWRDAVATDTSGEESDSFVRMKGFIKMWVKDKGH